MSCFLNIVVALPSEARPLIDLLKLRPVPMPHGLKLYCRGDYRLLISGIGKIASASAVGVLAGMSAVNDRHIWVNVGIAGHQNLPVGSAAIAHAITDVATQSTFYPSIAFASSIPSAAVHCFDEPTTDYAGAAFCDMESAAFYAAAQRYADTEFIHVLKVVSDNSAADLGALNRDSISRLMEEALDEIFSVIEQLLALDDRHRSSPMPLEIESLCSKWHFTVTQTAQLRELARRWSLVIDDIPWPPMATVESSTTAREVLARLTHVVDSKAVRLPPVQEHD